jgi:uncharacterized protein YoxC
MKTMKSAFRLALILYLSLFLTGAPFVLSGYAKITPKEPVDPERLITIVKGDTLWDLAAKHINPDKPWLWTEFKKYNDFTDPHWIYPGEKLQLPEKVTLERKVVEGLIEAEPLTKQELENIKKELAAAGMKIDMAAAEIRSLKEQLQDLSEQTKRIQSDLSGIQDTASSNARSIERLNESMMSQAEASKMEISRINDRIEALQREINRISDAQRAQSEDMKALNASTQSLAMDVGKSQESIDQLRAEISKLQESVNLLKAETGDWETPSKGKRTFAILAALAGGVAYFVASAIGRSD